MDIRQLAVSGLLGLFAVAELAARLSSGSTVRAGLAAGPVTHTGVSVPTALLMCSLCLLATVPASLLRPVLAAMAVGAGAVLSLILFELVTVAGAAALVLVAYRLARGGWNVLAVALAVPFLALALAEASSGVMAAAPASGLASASGEIRALAVALASAIPVAALAAMARRAREESRSHSAVRELTEGVLAEHLARGERAIIARELHDVVAHHISVIAV
jgi:signal transduction histidine kinase